MSVKEAKSILGIIGPYNAKMLKNAYKNAQKAVHPDLHPELRDANEKSQRVNAAYEELKKYLPKDEETFTDPLEAEIPNFRHRKPNYNSDFELNLRKRELLKKIESYGKMPSSMPSDPKLVDCINEVLSLVSQLKDRVNACRTLNELNREFNDLGQRFIEFNKKICDNYKLKYPSRHFSIPKSISLKEYVENLEKSVMKDELLETTKKKYEEKYSTHPGYKYLKYRIDSLINNFYHIVTEIGFCDIGFKNIKEAQLQCQINALFEKWPSYEKKLAQIKSLKTKIDMASSLIMLEELGELFKKIDSDSFDQNVSDLNNTLDDIISKKFLSDIYKAMQENCKPYLKVYEHERDYAQASEVFGVLKRATGLLNAYDSGLLLYDNLLDLGTMDFYSPKACHDIMDFMVNCHSEKINPSYTYIKEDGDTRWLAYVSYEDAKFYFNSFEVGSNGIEKKKMEIVSSKDIPKEYVSIMTFIINGSFVGKKYLLKEFVEDNFMINVLYKQGELCLAIDEFGHTWTLNINKLKETNLKVEEDVMIKDIEGILNIVKQSAEELYTIEMNK